MNQVPDPRASGSLTRLELEVRTVGLSIEVTVHIDFNLMNKSQQRRDVGDGRHLSLPRANVAAEPATQAILLAGIDIVGWVLRRPAR